MKFILKRSDVILLYALVGLIYIIGLFIPLMENDAAQHARTAMRMFLTNDYINLIKYDRPYLDKPHLHFWLAALSYKIFGISHFAYRLPSLLITVLGAYSTSQLARIFYGKEAAHIAAIVFLTAQTIILSNHDVRTDTVLTGMTIFSLWQIVKYFKTGQLSSIVWGALGAAMAFGSKGHLATFVIGVCVTVFVVQFNAWKRIFHWKFLLGILFWFVFAAPILYAYYMQYDLNGTLVNGKEVSGLKFILWDQNFQRFDGSEFGSTSPDYFFFFHTILWVFFPWSILMVLAFIYKFKSTKLKFTKETVYRKEVMTSVGFLVVFVIISFSKFKLPHYLNSLIPLLSVLVSGYIVKIFTTTKYSKLNGFLAYFQPILLGIASVFIIVLSVWAFPDLKLGFVFGLLALLLGLLFWMMYANSQKGNRWFFYTVYGVVVINFCLNSHFYQNLLQYQAGNIAAEVLKSEIGENEVLDNIYFIDGDQRRSWAFEFYLKKLIPTISLSEIDEKLDKGETVWVFSNYDSFSKETTPENIHSLVRQKLAISQYRMTKLKMKFINPNTRDNCLKWSYLFKLSKDETTSL